MKKKEIEAIMKIIIFFLSTLLFLSVFNGSVSLFTVVGALGCTYLFVHFWEKKYYRKLKVK